MQDELLEALEQASRGLLYTSETEAALETFAADAGTLTPARLRQLGGSAADAAISESTLTAFLRCVPAEDRAGFDRLSTLLLQRLSGVRVYRIGAAAHKRVLVVGAAPDGRWVGVRTEVVET
jgi:hypothetical protein